MKQSAGVLLYRFTNNEVEFFLVHPGGPFWAKKDSGAWSIPKGEFSENEDPLEAAKREFWEETGMTISGNFSRLSTVKQKGGKIVHAWALESDLDPAVIKSNMFEMEWPPKSRQTQQFPEIDKAGWFKINAAKEKILSSQLPILEELNKLLK
ncbi:NUDIX domain-containing protein [Solitalea canadensis]|uniref:Putative NTP pyrophosphohydrolase n=1 Tax=Solitalea canadensis (strain ATCC 29591 / DSM 3403 / JCM 21819 / LMG 8368 / NBRC 15130 / NCIMB 12057 / USAM 9D) TaxID=929556 RepID=H8KVZ6_SOLCM|nr:NUDIX domain-containing protein [Solitalea canadensis]AFD06899.1 putative NTP pyrophosphohydrolase [Solitalea canadensis DSM 3403]